MKKKDDDIQITLKGKVILSPEYIDQELVEYKNNPCIESLPHIFDDEEIIESLLKEPQIKDIDLEMRNNVRYHLINRLKDLFLPLVNHLKIEHILSSMLRRGYISRNPASKEFTIRLNYLCNLNKLVNDKSITDTNTTCDLITDKISEIPELERTTSECASLIGVSGMGKTQTIERLLLMYPQVVFHNSYKGKALTRTQIVWLKIDCPFDGSIKTLCKIFFKAVDDILGTTDYFGYHGTNKNSTSTMMILMAHIASLHSIGILVIDEIQHMIHPKSNPDEMLNFFVTLVNTIGIPILLIGTPKAAAVLEEKGLKNARRAIGSGSVFWDRLDRKSAEWNYFIEGLWEKQWLRKHTDISNELNDAMYFESQGIIAIAVTLFMLAQKQAIFEGKEKLTASLIHNVAQNDMKLVRKYIRAIRNGNTRLIKKYEDVSLDTETLCIEHEQQLTSKENVIEMSNQIRRKIEESSNHTKDLIFAELKALNIFNDFPDDCLRKIINDAVAEYGMVNDISCIKETAIINAIEENRSFKKNFGRKTDKSKIVYSEFGNDDLRKLYDELGEDKNQIHDVFLEKGCIRKPQDEFNDKVNIGVTLC